MPVTCLRILTFLTLVTNLLRAVAQEPVAATNQWAIPSSPAQFHVFLLMGQSNMSGYGELLPEDRTPVPHVLRLPTKGELRWEPAAHPLHNRLPSDRFGLGIPFATAYLKGKPDVVVGLIPVAWGGAGIDQLKKGTPTYADALAKARFAMTAGVIKGVLWHQGESDSVTPAAADTYRAKLHQLIADLRQDLGNGKLPFVAGNLAEFYGTGPEHNAPDRVKRISQIRDALRALPREVTCTGFAESTGCTSIDQHMVHFDRASYQILGSRYCAAYEAIAERRPAVVAQVRPLIAGKPEAQPQISDEGGKAK